MEEKIIHNQVCPACESSNKQIIDIKQIASGFSLKSPTIHQYYVCLSCGCMFLDTEKIKDYIEWNLKH